MRREHSGTRNRERVAEQTHENSYSMRTFSNTSNSSLDKCDMGGSSPASENVIHVRRTPATSWNNRELNSGSFSDAFLLCFVLFMALVS